MRGIICVFVSVLFSLSGVKMAAGQDGDEKGPPVAFRMVCLKHVPGKSDVFLAPVHVKGVSAKRDTGGGGGVRVAEGKLTLPQNNLSPWLRARPVNGELVFFSEEGDGETEGAVPVARAVFPAETSGEVYLIFVPAPASAKGGVAYQVAVVDARTNVFSAGTHLVYNLTRSQVRGRMGQNGFALNPGQREIVGEVKTDHPRGYFEVLLEQRDAAAGADAIWERLARTQWKVDPTARRLCLVFDDPGRGRIAVRTFNEYLVAIDGSAVPMDPRPRPEDGITKEADAP